MKSKILLLSTIYLFIISCNSDDENSGPPPIPEDEKLIENIVDSYNYTFQFGYNSDKTLKSFNYANFYMMNAFYEDNRVSSLLLLIGGDNAEYYFEYDENGRVSSVSQDDNVKQVVYNSGQNYYIAHEEDGDETTIYLNQYDDIKKVVLYDAADDETTEFLYLYDDDHKGTMTNSSHLNLHLLLCSADFYSTTFLMFMSNKPVTTLSIEGFGLSNAEYEYDEQGFISKGIFVGNGEESGEFIFNYTQL